MLQEIKEKQKQEDTGEGDSPMAIEVTIFAPIAWIGIVRGHHFLDVVNIDGVFLKDASQFEDEVV